MHPRDSLNGHAAFCTLQVIGPVWLRSTG